MARQYQTREAVQTLHDKTRPEEKYHTWLDNTRPNMKHQTYPDKTLPDNTTQKKQYTRRLDVTGPRDQYPN
ncbi:hypothetical protein DPMN_154844 [Dreissena polymorpha]|uniref:Uncharacterized protein n=1 Tax=Dreissena polymorpha TaxID=45954 RepID=A0A9D4FSL7_DREPO|nr:hypothetical protein DPMN_154844 [Dreissena polymorpha]